MTQGQKLIFFIIFKKKFAPGADVPQDDPEPQDQRAQQRHTGRGGRAGEPAVARDIWHQDGGEPRWQFQPSGLITCLLIKYFLVSKTVFKTQQGEGAKKT